MCWQQVTLYFILRFVFGAILIEIQSKLWWPATFVLTTTTTMTTKWLNRCGWVCEWVVECWRQSCQALQPSLELVKHQRQLHSHLSALSFFFLNKLLTMCVCMIGKCGFYMQSQLFQVFWFLVIMLCCGWSYAKKENCC